MAGKKKQVIKKRGGGMAKKKQVMKKRGGGIMKKASGGMAISPRKKMAMGM